MTLSLVPMRGIPNGVGRGARDGRRVVIPTRAVEFVRRSARFTISTLLFLRPSRNVDPVVPSHSPHPWASDHPVGYLCGAAILIAVVRRRRTTTNVPLRPLSDRRYHTTCFTVLKAAVRFHFLTAEKRKKELEGYSKMEAIVGKIAKAAKKKNTLKIIQPMDFIFLFYFFIEYAPGLQKF